MGRPRAQLTRCPGWLALPCRRAADGDQYRVGGAHDGALRLLHDFRDLQLSCSDWSRWCDVGHWAVRVSVTWRPVVELGSVGHYGFEPAIRSAGPNMSWWRPGLSGLWAEEAVLSLLRGVPTAVPTAGFEPATHGLGNRRSIP